ncbi:MAG: AraC family transcriptional regulator [Lachnospiraceae bacterium]|nr:AraC family transcriptional regulator [Lachnospiraceae bacterium]
MSLSVCSTQVDVTGRELAEHGRTAFPVACYYDDLAKESVPWHWHTELEAVVVTEGEAVIAVDFERCRAKAGEGFFINSGVLHGCWNVDASACRFHSVVFHPRLVGGNMDSIFWDHYLRPILENTSLKSIILKPELPWHRDILNSVEACWQSCVREAPGYEFAVRNALSQIIFQIAAHAGGPAGPASPRALRDDTRIKQMLQYIQAHYSEEISLEQIAESAAVSESECLRCFRSTIGTTPIQYLKLYRLQRAAELLKNTAERIVDIGVQCGFQDMSYFAKAFRSVYGCAPTEFRRKENV